jgi:hypothetical protein
MQILTEIRLENTVYGIGKTTQQGHYDPFMSIAFCDLIMVLFSM